MADQITYIRPSGNPLTVEDNEANREYAEKAGWTVKPKEKRKAKAK